MIKKGTSKVVFIQYLSVFWLKDKGKSFEISTDKMDFYSKFQRDMQ